MAGSSFIAGDLKAALKDIPSATHEFTGPGSPWQNAHVESKHVTIKRKFPDFEDFIGLEDLARKLEEFMTV